MAIYGLGLPAFVLQKVLQPLFFAREDTVSPFRYAVVAMVLNAAIALGLAPVIGWIAPAIATTLAGWAMVALLAIGARKMGSVAQFDARFHSRIWRIIVASLLMGVILWFTSAILLGPFLGMAGWRYLALLVLVSTGILSYFGLGQVLGAFRLSDFRGALRRG